MVELLVGMAVGLLVLLAVTTVYINVLRTSSGTLDGSRLNQEMSAIMNIMANDIRRAGYWGGAATAFTNPTSNPFTVVEDAATAGDISALRIHNNGGSGTAYDDVTYDANGFVSNTTSAGSCITYTYDADKDHTLDDDEKFGFRWDGTNADALLMRTSNTASGPNSCTDGNWLSVNDVNEIVITNLEFSIRNSSCLNASEPDGSDDDAVAGDADNTTNPEEFDCYAVAPTPEPSPSDGSGNSTVETLLVDITLEAALADDLNVKMKQTQSVELRNNLIRAR